MKKHLLLVALMPVVVCCTTKPVSENKPTETVEEVVIVEQEAPAVVAEEPKEEKVVAKEPLPQDVKQFMALYKELLSFKNSSDFKRMGFGKGSKYNKWLTQANKLSDTADISHFIEYNFLPGDLVSLAMVYAASQGKENAASQTLRAIIDEGIAMINENH